MSQHQFTDMSKVKIDFILIKQNRQKNALTKATEKNRNIYLIKIFTDKKYSYAFLIEDSNIHFFHEIELKKYYQKDLF